MLVLTSFGLGIRTGLSAPLSACTAAQVDPLQVFIVNAALCVLLVAGVLSFGAATLVACVYVLMPTGATVGAIVATLGWHGVALLAPHGLLELAAWVVAAAVGMHGPLDRLRGAGRGGARGRSGAPRLPDADGGSVLGTAVRGVVLAGLLLAVASLVEWIWTDWYGIRIGC